MSVYDDLNPERISYEGRCCGVCRWPRCKTKAHNCKLFFFKKKKHNIMNAGVHWFRDDIKRKYNGIAEGYSSQADGWSKRLLYKQQLKPWRPSRARWWSTLMIGSISINTWSAPLKISSFNHHQCSSPTRARKRKYSVGRLINAYLPAVSLSKSAAAVSCDARVCPNTLNR